MILTSGCYLFYQRDLFAPVKRLPPREGRQGPLTCKSWILVAHSPGPRWAGEFCNGKWPAEPEKKLNMEPENGPLEKEKHRPKPPIFGFHVNFWGCIFKLGFTSSTIPEGPTILMVGLTSRDSSIKNNLRVP